MNNQKEKEKAILEKWGGLYRAALGAEAERLASMEKAMEQYLGSSEIDGSSEKARTVRNITYEIIESQICADIPLPKADPQSLTNRHEKNARSIERLLSSVRSSLPFEESNDRDERFTYIYGGSVWYAEWDNSISDGDLSGGESTLPVSSVLRPSAGNQQNRGYGLLLLTLHHHQMRSDEKIRYSTGEALAS